MMYMCKEMCIRNDSYNVIKDIKILLPLADKT